MIWVAKNLYFFNCLLDGAHTTSFRTTALFIFIKIEELIKWIKDRQWSMRSDIKYFFFRKSKAGLIFLRCRSNHIQIIQI